MKNSDKLRKALLVCYTGLMCFLLLTYLWIIMIYNGSSKTPDWIWIGRLTAALLGIYLSKSWKNSTFQLLVLFLTVLLARGIIRQGNTPSDYRTILRIAVNGLWVWGGCYSLGRVLTKEQFKVFFKIFGSAWTIGMAACALCGLYASWMRVRIPNLSGERFIGLWGPAAQARLELVFLSTVSGGFMAMSVIIAIICLLCFQKKLVKCLFSFAALLMLLALALTDSRSAQVSVSGGAAVLAWILLLHREQKPLSRFSPARPPTRRLLISFAWAAATFVGMLFLIQLINPAFDQLKRASLHWPVFRSEAMAGEEQIISANRGFFGEHTSTGRAEIWGATLTYLRYNPKYLLIGKSVIDPITDVNALLSEEYQAGHCHNILLQVLLESGLPGLLLLCMIIFSIGKQAVKLAMDGSSPLWQRAFTALAAAICVEDLAECVSSLNGHYLPFLAVLNISAGLISSGTEENGLVTFQARKKKLRDTVQRMITGIRTGWPYAIKAMKPILFLTVLLASFIPCKYSAISYHAVIHQDDYDDPEKDLYYYCGNENCETHHGRHTIKTSGCGLCAIVNAVAYMTGETIDVHEAAAFARENEHYAVHVGSKMSVYQAFAEEYGEKYNFSYVARVETLEEATEYLKQGCVVIAGVGNNGGGGHLLVLADYNAYTNQYVILDSAGNYPGWSHDFYSCQAINNNRLEHNPNVFLTSFQVYYSPAEPVRDI
ncbi:MAG: O-antigen ligase family protein [Clostridia bacterium]|nr:O-antigen ligase family protein [Clostridia bacterium]